MKSTKSEAVQAQWLITQIRQLDQMIDLHQHGGSSLMLGQYKSRRLEFFKQLIDLLTHSAYNTTGTETFPLISQLIYQNYLRKRRPSKAKPVKDGFEQTIMFYETATKIHTYAIEK